MMIASDLFRIEFAKLCASYKGRRASARLVAEARAKLSRMVDWLYEKEGHMIDGQDGTPIIERKDAHVVVRFDEATRELHMSVVRRRGRVH